MKATEQLTDQPSAIQHKGNFSSNPFRLLQKKPDNNPFQLPEKETVQQPKFNPFQLLVENQYRPVQRSSSAIPFQLVAIAEEGKNEIDQLLTIITHLEELHKAAEIVQSKGEATPGIDKLAQDIAVLKKVAANGDIPVINKTVTAFKQEQAGESPSPDGAKTADVKPVQQKPDGVAQRIVDWAIAAIVVGVVVGVAAIAGGIYACVRAYRNRNQAPAAPAAAAPAPRDGNRVRRDLDDGPLNLVQAQGLLGFITHMEGFIQAEDYQQAYTNMFERIPAVQHGFGIQVDVHRADGTAEECAENNMSYASQRRIRLCIPNDNTWIADRNQARRVMPMHLEEYIHQYQARSNQFASQNTVRFKEQTHLGDMAETRRVDDADFDEIDVMARLMDSGFDVEDIGYVDRYPERRAYMNWRQAQP